MQSLLKRYAVVCFLTIVAFLVISMGLQQFFGLSIGSAGSVVTALVPAMDAGQTYARKYNVAPSGAAAWKSSALMVVVNFVISAAVMVVGLLIYGGLAVVGGMLAQTQMGLWALIIALIGVFYLLITRLFFGLGAKGVLRAG